MALVPSTVATYFPPTKFDRPGDPVPPRPELWLLTDPPRVLRTAVGTLLPRAVGPSLHNCVVVIVTEERLADKLFL